MKQVIKSIAAIIGCAILGVVLSGAVLLVFALLLSIPDVLAWIAGYVGELLTYGVFFTGSIIGIFYGLTKNE